MLIRLFGLHLLIRKYHMIEQIFIIQLKLEYWMILKAAEKRKKYTLIYFITSIININNHLIKANQIIYQNIHLKGT